MNNYNNSSYQIINSLAKITALRSMMKSKELSDDEYHSLKGMKVIDDFLNAKVNSEEEAKLKKIFVAAVITSKEFGHINLGGNYTAEQIAISISEGLTKLKIQHLVGCGEYDVSDAEKIELDHIIANLAITVERIVDDYFDKIPQKIEDFVNENYDKAVTALTGVIGVKIGVLLGPDIAVNTAPVIDGFIRRLKPQVCETIRRGAKYIIDYTKPRINKFIKEGAMVVQKAYNWVKDFITGSNISAPGPTPAPQIQYENESQS